MREYMDRLEIAQNHFDWASDPAEVDIAIYELNAAERALAHYMERQKEERKRKIVQVAQI